MVFCIYDRYYFFRLFMKYRMCVILFYMRDHISYWSYMKMQMMLLLLNSSYIHMVLCACAWPSVRVCGFLLSFLLRTAHHAILYSDGACQSKVYAQSKPFLSPLQRGRQTP